MAEKIKLVQGDTRPALIVTLTDENTGNPITLTGASVSLFFRAVGGSSVLSTLPGTVTDAANGVVAFYWASVPTSLNVDAGDYEGEVQITFSDGQIQTVYDLLKFKVREDF